ncbi:unnamed protein product [Lampetra fluviatilis]
MATPDHASSVLHVIVASAAWFPPRLVKMAAPLMEIPARASSSSGRSSLPGEIHAVSLAIVVAVMSSTMCETVALRSSNCSDTTRHPISGCYRGEAVASSAISSAANS